MEPPLPGFDHRSRGGLGAAERALEVHVVDRVPVRLGEVEEGDARKDARVVDEAVEPAAIPQPESGLDDPAHGAGIGDAALHQGGRRSH